MRTPVRHAIFWIIVYLLWTYMKSSQTLFTTYLLINLVNVPIYMAAFYLLKEIQIPKLFNTGKYLKFALSILLSSCIFYTFWRLMGLLWIDRARGFTNANFMSSIGFLTQTVQFYSPAMALLAWDSFYDRKQEQERIQELEKEKLTTELKFLKAQLNPHFLFNTLNNLYSFVVNGSPKAPDMIMRLSGMLDYVLYKSQNDQVNLSEEINAIENFIELEQIRYGERLKIDYTSSGNLSTPVSPLLLLSIVENAFKHGASGDIDQPKITINISAEENIIHCKVWNTKSTLQGEINDEYKEGIGLSNIKRQLDLVYPNLYELDIDDQSNSFSISIVLKPMK